mmetsp:Transcript_28125/g.80685  ORF Transcript_28125/g.80685 Transcript_28125/m.80685 type:complete len:291 (+) Transcript_28125:181-1053(+)
MAARPATRLRPPPAKAAQSRCTRRTRSPRVCSSRLPMLSCSSDSSTPSETSKSFRNLIFCSAVASSRCLMRSFSPAPQVAEQALHSFHSPHMQYTGSWHCLVQLLVSSEANASHGAPPQLGSVRTWRKRLRSPPHLSQALHSPQSSQAQSWGSQSAEQGARAQPCTSASTSSHCTPPFAGGVSTCRSRICEPPPQLALHALQAAQDSSWQSTGGGPWQACGVTSPGPGLQGEVSFIGPIQNFPSPLPCTAISRERRFTPSQVPVQSLQAAHSPKTQSTASSHGTSSLQLA